MSESPQTRPPARRRRAAASVVLALAVAATTGTVLGCQAVATPSSAAAPPLGATEDDGVVPDGVTVFDDEFPAVANLDPALLAALRRAATAAAGDGVELTVTSGWRSPAYQDQLLHEAISEYGSAEEAARWVATPARSLHVSGDAVDIGHSAATAWLSEHGAGYDLCRVYRNEPWHYELRPGAAEHGCPSPYPDPAHDPRVQR